jgi:uncharacterized protein YyaL (SSP411 family)
MPNRLADEQSPYLRQHKDNPVDWYPWGEDAFETARTEDKPIFLSIGYSTCHWCHVMERESFEDEEVARLMNEAFVSIKVDREERPDVDALYMEVCQMMRGRGGWPLTVLLTPERKPFFAATYLPKEGRFQQTGMMDLIPKVKRLWHEDREKLLQDADKLTEVLQRSADEEGGTETLDEATLAEAHDQLSRQFDQTHGGFGSAPKFPAPHNLLFLLRHGHRTGGARAREMVTTTLDQMQRGGVYDQVGGGFHRYSTDQRWLLPHFEKMLYDQAMHVLAYTEAYQATGRERYRRTAEAVIAYVQRDLQAPEGGFYSAEDADSLTDDGEMEEGAFYVWSIEEIRDALDEATAELVIDVYNLTPEGNYQDESTGKRTGKNVLYRERPLDAEAERLGMTPDRLRETLDDARATLRARRDDRSRPALDDKVLTDWNGLMIAAVAKAARTFDEPAYETAAVEAATFLLDTMRNDDGQLLHRYRNGDAAIRAQLDDYAFLVWGLTELYETTFDPKWLQAALTHLEVSLDQFWDEERGGFYLTAQDADDLIVRPKEASDGAMPSGNSVQLMNLLRLGRLTGRTAFAERADDLARWAGPQVRTRPTGATALLTGLEFALGPSREVVISGAAEAEDTAALVDVVRSVYSPSAVVLHRPPGERAAITRMALFTEAQTPLDGRAAAYVCRDYRCEAPTTDPETLREQLTQGSE